MLIVMTTAPNIGEAESLAESIVEAKLAACVQILPPMTSIYYWDGAIRKEPEHLLLIKTVREKFPGLAAFIKEHHSYEIPEITAIATELVSDSYLAWMDSYLTG